MKKILLGSLTFLMVFGLSACHDDDASSSTISSSVTPISDSSGNENPSQEDFTIKTSDNGLSATESSYTFSTIQDGDSFPPEAKIRLTTDSSWNGCTRLTERYTRIVAEDEKVLPEGSVSLDLVLNSDLVGSSGSNEIDAIDIIFDREFIQPGESKLKIEVKPGNGLSSMNILTTICLDIHVKAFGTIEVETYNITLNVDLTGLEDIIARESETPTAISLGLTDTAAEEEVYGYSADYNVQIDIPLTETYTSASIENFKFAVGHTYGVQIFVEGEEVSDRIWICLEAKSSSSDYSLEPNAERGNSLLTIHKDNVVIEAKLGDYHAL